MIDLKTTDEITLIKDGAQILSKMHGLMAQSIAPGISLEELDQLAEAFIREHGGVPSFKGYHGFPATLCLSVNEEVIHGIPGKRQLKEGDILSVDCGVYYKGFHSDQAYTYPVGSIDPATLKLLQVTRASLHQGIAVIKEGTRIGDISHAIQEYIRPFGYGIVREFGGHGLGRELHEDPHIPNYGRRGTKAKIKDGMVLAIEPMVNLGSQAILELSDGWTIVTQDRKASAHFEHTVAIVGGQAEILTTEQYIEEFLNF